MKLFTKIALLGFFTLLITVSARSQSLFLFSAIQQSNQTDRSIDFSATVRQVLGTSQVNAEFVFAYRKVSETNWTIWSNSVFAVIQKNSSVTITFPGVQIAGNTGAFQVVIAYRNLANNLWYKLGEWKINGTALYLNPQTINLTFSNTLEDIEDILNKIELGLSVLKMAANEYEYFKELKGVIREKFQKEKDKIGNTIAVINTANSVLGYINTINSIGKEKDVVKQYFMLMSALASNTLPPPFSDAFKSYAEIGIQFKNAIDRIVENYGIQTFALAPYSYTVQLKIRRTDYRFLGNSLDEYYKSSEIEKFVAGYSVLVYDAFGAQIKSQALSPEKRSPSDTNISLGLWAPLENFGDVAKKVFLLIEFMNGQSVVVPLGDPSFITFESSNINVGIDLRTVNILNNFSKEARYKISVFKP